MERIKEVVSISIGSSARDHEVEIELEGECFKIRREGTDGDMEKARRRFAELDGTVDAFGLGGTDIYLRAAGRDYYFRDTKKMIADVKHTPVVCGSGLKGAVEASTVKFMQEELGLDLAGKRCLVPSAVDRFGLAQALYEAGCRMTYGDLLYSLGIPVMIHRWRSLHVLIKTLAPIAVQLPFEWLYPTGDKQHDAPADTKHAHLYRDNDIIAGDFHYVCKYMPEDMRGKWLITNTTTPSDVENMRSRGVELMVTSTPRLNGRSFGTNVIEATLVALKGANGPLPEAEYVELLRQVGFRPDVQWLQTGQTGLADQAESATSGADPGIAACDPRAEPSPA